MRSMCIVGGRSILLILLSAIFLDHKKISRLRRWGAYSILSPVKDNSSWDTPYAPQPLLFAHVLGATLNVKCYAFLLIAPIHPGRPC